MLQIKEIAEKTNGRVEGDNNINIIGVCDLKVGKKNHIAFLSDLKYLPYFKKTSASAILVSKSFINDFTKKTIIRVKDPSLSFFEIVSLFYPKEKSTNLVQDTVIIGDETLVAPSCSIGHNSVIGNNSKIGDQTVIGSLVSIGKHVSIGRNVTIKSNVTIYDNVVIGDNVIIDAGTVIGSDGFGIYSYKGKHHKIPHIGKVIIGDDVLIGSNCCIDRGTLNDTIIGESTKIDNLIHIAHNVEIGRGCLIAAQVGISGSTVIKDNVSIGGQVGLIGHLTIGSGAKIASKSAVFKSVESDEFVSGIPSRNHKSRIKEDYLIRKLPNMNKRIKKLETSNE